MEDFKKIATKGAHEAGSILKKNLGQIKKIDYKGEVNLVTEIDQLSEKIITKIINDRYPDHEILAEESGAKKSTSPYRWIIDPLDGTTNYAHGYPYFCVSIALEKEAKILLGVVYNPILDELFLAEKGKGAYLNGAKIQVSTTNELTRSLLATGFPYDIRESSINNLNNFNRFALKAQAIRRAGSAALDLCYVAMGRFDGFWELKLCPWDTAAGALMVTEAGGRVTDFKGNEFSIYSGDNETLASNSKIHKEMLGVLMDSKNC
jgi:myo-inositol-1(or 4)-monophosphatase